jgi:hypothetical protein
LSSIKFADKFLDKFPVFYAAQICADNSINFLCLIFADKKVVKLSEEKEVLFESIMNVLNNSGDELPECPLCMEPLEVDVLNFYPCTCGYQICRFCWHRIRTDEIELCPACRKAYPENPADFTPLTQEQISALKAEKRQRDQQRKQKLTENRKHLANVRWLGLLSILVLRTRACK